MGSINLSLIEQHNKAVVAAHFDMDKAIPSLSQYIGYRQAYAQGLLNCDPGDEKQRSTLQTAIDYANEQIKQILGI